MFNVLKEFITGQRLKVEEKISYEIDFYSRCVTLHNKVFPKFKNFYNNRDVVIIAGGPTVNDYVPIEGAINIAVNRSFLYNKVSFDYLFIQDYQAILAFPNELKEFAANNKTTNIFYGYFTPEEDSYLIPESIAIRDNAYRYYARSRWLEREEVFPFKNDFSYDLSAQPLQCYGSIAFPAAQFALWTNPKRIYLVGCDCTTNGHFVKSNLKPKDELGVPFVIQGWKKFKNFANRYYPDTEIICVNPVGLKGVFKDLYQNSNIEKEK